jgi:hypothetical protein
MNENKTAKTPADGEPVAWCIVESGRVHGLVKSKPAVMNAEKWKPLYTAPPKRDSSSWVGLTDEDKQEAFDETQEASGGFWEFADYLEAKLKEKNT